MTQLFVRFDCPYCQKVLRKMQEMDIQSKVEVIDAAHGTPGREKVLEVGKKNQVPFLIDGDMSMYESDDIIGYLERKFG